MPFSADVARIVTGTPGSVAPAVGRVAPSGCSRRRPEADADGPARR